ncbi:hypothetical protein CRP01_01755 [Flavilitoribacter nigricans DSM 23189 = NBRC 102662]|uniref:Uncharacterized protein n=1 Tax=Flavilitoribacter nigricans (strain ATCC 23147 / DSM 23189 / NBRC 102662 / NCIMB 1420 / SS-2) TaxID=1122177 RepID=A0A2D0NJJ0_FLAN2|nr:hypothetical protein CRP01_01755 [Flavilitoribacter nigricans DSM 23189 = NBRC 102662]
MPKFPSFPWVTAGAYPIDAATDARNPEGLWAVSVILSKVPTSVIRIERVTQFIAWKFIFNWVMIYIFFGWSKGAYPTRTGAYTHVVDHCSYVEFRRKSCFIAIFTDLLMLILRMNNKVFYLLIALAFGCAQPMAHKSLRDGRSQPAPSPQPIEKSIPPFSIP